MEMETCGKHLAPSMQTISNIFKGALTTFRIETKTCAILDLRLHCHGLLYNRPHTSRIY